MTGAVAEQAAVQEAPAPAKKEILRPMNYWIVNYLPEYDRPEDMGEMAFVLPRRNASEDILDLYVLRNGSQWTKISGVLSKDNELFTKFPENRSNQGCWVWAKAWNRGYMEFVEATGGGNPLDGAMFAESMFGGDPEGGINSKPAEFDKEGFLKTIESDEEFRKRIKGLVK